MAKERVRSVQRALFHPLPFDIIFFNCVSQYTSLSCPYSPRGGKTAAGINSIFRKFPLRTKWHVIKGTPGNQYFRSGCVVRSNIAVFSESF